MAEGIAAAAANSALDTMWTTYSWVKLHVGATTVGASNAATETTRKQITTPASASGGSKATGATLTWTSVAGSEDYTAFSVWTASTAPNPQGTALALAVQPLDSWRELWVFRQGPQGWSVDVVPPAADHPGLGYIEFAGWVPGGRQLLAAREARIEGRHRQSFEVLRMTTLEVEKQADRPNNLSSFYRWQSPAWKAITVSIR